MYDKYRDYMYYLLTSPFKRVKKNLNQWYILFRVLGSRFDDAMESLYAAAEQTMVASCSPEMLAVHAEDRGLKKYDGEEEENFRARIALYREVCRLGGTNQGILLAARTLGYKDVAVETVKKLKGDKERWAEFYVLVRVEAGQEFPIPFAVFRKEIQRWKEVGAKDNYQFTIENTGWKNEIAGNCRAVQRLSGTFRSETGICQVIRMESRNSMSSSLIVNVKNNLWYLNGEYKLDGTKRLDAYERIEEMP